MAKDLLRINLLPESARKPAALATEQFYRTPLVLIAAVIMVLLPLGLLIPLQLNRQQMGLLNKKITALEPRRAEVSRVQDLLAKLRAQQSAFEGLREGADSWAQRLNILSGVTPHGMWFTELSLDEMKGLIIQGMAIASEGPEMVSVTRLVQDLQSDAAFASAFKQVQLESIKRIQLGDFDAVQFTVTCTVAQPAGS